VRVSDAAFSRSSDVDSSRGGARAPSTRGESLAK
jgi:hypothetical protein